jgi:hypothetical protein
MSSGTVIRQNSSSFWTREYLLDHCEGYRVSTPDAHVGFVETVVRNPTTEAPTALAVRACGDFALVEVPIDRVAEVRADAEEIVLEATGAE